MKVKLHLGFGIIPAVNRLACQCASKLLSDRHRETGSCSFINECNPYYVGKDKNNHISAIDTKAIGV